MLNLARIGETYKEPVTVDNIDKLNGHIIYNRATARYARVKGKYLCYLNKNKEVIDVVNFLTMFGEENSNTTPWRVNLVTN